MDKNMDNYITTIDIINCIIGGLSLLIGCIALRRTEMGKRPYIKLIKMFFDPKDFHFYDGSSLSDNHKNIIKSMFSNNIVFGKQFIDDVEYLVVNTLKDKEIDDKDIRLILAPYQFSYINTGCFVNEISLKGATIKLNQEDKYRKSVMDYKITPYEDRNIINIKIAYVCKIGDNTSVVYERLIGKKYFNYIEDNTIAKDIINFENETYVIECNQVGKKTKIKLIYEMKKRGLKYSQKYL